MPDHASGGAKRPIGVIRCGDIFPIHRATDSEKPEKFGRYGGSMTDKLKSSADSVSGGRTLPMFSLMGSSPITQGTPARCLVPTGLETFGARRALGRQRRFRALETISHHVCGGCENCVLKSYSTDEADTMKLTPTAARTCTHCETFTYHHTHADTGSHKISLTETVESRVL